MTIVLLFAALTSGATLPAAVQQASPVPVTGTGQSAPASQKPLDGDSPIEAIAATPAGKASLDKNLSGVLTHPAYDQFKGMSLRALAPLSGGLITDQKIAAVEADLKTSK